MANADEAARLDQKQRMRQAALANLRQRLQAPAGALTGYSEILVDEARERGLSELGEDIHRILTAARTLAEIVDGLLNPDTVRELLGSEDIAAAERKLRHDIRTPLNGIKGYGEMLLEDLDDFDAEVLRPDLEKLQLEADRLLNDLDGIVRFGHHEEDDVAPGLDSTGGMMTDLVRSIAPVNESTIRDETGDILVVDDIEANRDLLARRLNRDGHRVVTAADGIEALEKLQESTFDLVLLDLMMPGMNGYEVLRTMKSDAGLRHIPVIMISALDETDSVLRCIEAGAQDYLLKPFDPVLLKARIGSGLESKKWTDDERQQRQFIRKAFSRFLSPAVVDQLMSDPSRLSLGGERTEITCVFTDLEGFTTLIEKGAPSVILPALNRYLDGLCRIVLDHDGTIDKIVGDALHAFFGAPLPQADHAEKAMRCVLDLDRYARAFRSQGEGHELGFGATRIGVHTGTAVVGNFGGDAFFDYTAHGDVINTAARMESVNKHLGTTICASAATASRCPDLLFRPVGTLTLKGKDEGIESFELLDPERVNASWLKAYLEAFALLDRDSAAAREAFSRLVQNYPDDPLSNWHHRRLQREEAGSRVIMNEK